MTKGVFQVAIEEVRDWQSLCVGQNAINVSMAHDGGLSDCLHGINDGWQCPHVHYYEYVMLGHTEYFGMFIANQSYFWMHTNTDCACVQPYSPDLGIGGAG